MQPLALVRRVTAPRREQAPIYKVLVPLHQAGHPGQAGLYCVAQRSAVLKQGSLESLISQSRLRVGSASLEDQDWIELRYFRVF
jgi:hypothetical protein